METDFEGDLNPQFEEGIQKAEWVERAAIPSLYLKMLMRILNFYGRNRVYNRTESGTIEE